MADIKNTDDNEAFTIAPLSSLSRFKEPGDGSNTITVKRIWKKKTAAETAPSLQRPTTQLGNI